MGWHGHLQLNYRRAGDRTVLHDRHDGPLRVLQSLYPEGPGICHNVLVHPPGGIVGGDVLEVEARVAEGAHALITTPGATRFYRSAGDLATQAVSARVDSGGRLEWLPLETIAFSGCSAENRMRFELAPDAEMIGWDVLALGLPASDRPFERGHYLQSIELPDRWLERGVIDAADHLLLESPLGFAGHRVIGTLWFAAGSALAEARRESLLEAARSAARAHGLARTAGVTAAQPEVVVMRVLAPAVEPAIDLLTQAWRAWREVAWGLAAARPRVWRT
ncbi:MAG TPA: urease accessory protein UreD [Caldimonas sp.]